MTCLRSADIYLHLEKELDPAAAREADEHLRLCSACRRALEGRRAFLEAVAGIPDLGVPPGLSEKILARIPSIRPSRVGGLVALFIGLSWFVLGSTAYVLLAGQSPAGFLIEATKSAWEFIRDASLAFIKLIKLTAIGLDLFVKFIGDAGKALARVGAFISPEVFVACLLLFLALTAVFVACIRKMFLHGEKP